MIINGRGQIGERLKKYMFIQNWDIYHTWNFLEKDSLAQNDCLDKFKHYLSNKGNQKVCFISTKSQELNPYVASKKEVERLVLEDDGTVIRLCNLVGKGICQKFRDKDINPFGIIEISTIDSAVELIRKRYDEGGIIEMKGELIDAKIVKELIKYGKHKY